MNGAWILRGQDSSTPVLQDLCRRAAIAGRNFKRRTEVLARMAQADTQTVMTANLVVERADISQLFPKLWRGLGDAALKLPADLAGQPRLTLRSAPDHDRIGAGCLERGDRLVERSDVAVDDQRNLHGVLDGAYRAPVGLTLVELTAGSAMHGAQLHAAGFCAACQFRRIQR